MQDSIGKVKSIEGVLKDLLLKIGVTEANHIAGNDALERGRRLLKMTLRNLTELDDDLGDSPAMSMEQPLCETQEHAANVLSHKMGFYIPPEHR